MKLPLRLKSFRHGVHPDDHKEGTEHLAVEHMPFSPRYVLPLAQGGKASKPVVRKGQGIVRGELLAQADGFVSTCLHSPVYFFNLTPWSKYLISWWRRCGVSMTALVQLDAVVCSIFLTIALPLLRMVMKSILSSRRLSSTE